MLSRVRSRNSVLPYTIILSLPLSSRVASSVEDSPPASSHRFVAINRHLCRVKLQSRTMQLAFLYFALFIRRFNVHCARMHSTLHLAFCSKTFVWLCAMVYPKVSKQAHTCCTCNLERRGVIRPFTQRMARLMMTIAVHTRHLAW